MKVEGVMASTAKITNVGNVENDNSISSIGTSDRVQPPVSAKIAVFEKVMRDNCEVLRKLAE
jgi:hypothetical protein